MTYVASRFVPAVTGFSTLAGAAGGLCRVIAQAPAEFLSTQTAVHVPRPSCSCS
ncbi:hypothetical protein [Actinomadura sp. DC4]|uniref:hypothetical protein n=1 Tax=Actinomadura sp. DC4 TaxID=3055069 RepID=UPI0025B08A75|nr:hypothetical protein [Actinomadura sp. DC4]MDN3352430.1 hypothetical protein [Actinomadura sp. DC4]